MTRPSLVLMQGDLQKKYYDNFTYELDKSIRNFLAVDENNENQSKNDYFSSNNIHYSSSLDFDNLKVNINTDDATTLTQVSGITTSIANSIVTYRTEIGLFSSLEHLMEVYGIGNATYHKIRNYVILHA